MHLKYFEWKQTEKANTPKRWDPTVDVSMRFAFQWLMDWPDQRPDAISPARWSAIVAQLANDPLYY